LCSVSSPEERSVEPDRKSEIVTSQKSKINYPGFGNTRVVLYDLAIYEISDSRFTI